VRSASKMGGRTLIRVPFSSGTNQQQQLKWREERGRGKRRHGHHGKTKDYADSSEERGKKGKD